MPTLVTLEIKRTVQVIIPDESRVRVCQLVADRDGDDIGDVDVIEQRTITMEEAANNHYAARLNDAGTALTVDEVDWIEGQT